MERKVDPCNLLRREVAWSRQALMMTPMGLGFMAGKKLFQGAKGLAGKAAGSGLGKGLKGLAQRKHLV